MFSLVKDKKRTIFFTIIFLFGSLGTLLFANYCVEIYEHKKKINKTILTDIPKHKLQHFVFSKNEAINLDWEHQKEFEFKNQMYDVVHAEIKDDKIHYWCWKDDKESELNANLNQIAFFLLGNSQSERKGELQLMKLKNSLFCDNLYPMTLKVVNSKTTIIDQYRLEYSDIHIKKHTPPPKLS